MSLFVISVYFFKYFKFTNKILNFIRMQKAIYFIIADKGHYAK